MAYKFSIFNVSLHFFCCEQSLTNDQKRTLERVFDIVIGEYKKKEADGFINTIASNF